MAVWIAVLYGEFLGFQFSKLWVTLLTILTIVFSVFMLAIKNGNLDLKGYKFIILILFSSIVPRLYFLFNENPVFQRNLRFL
jgi:hypothetical protein